MSSSRAITPGTTIERYRVERRVGSGSMGEVYLGVDIGLDRKVALKILSDRHRDNRELRARFVREAKAVAAIAHPNVVQVFTTGTYDGRPYIAMEFLDGTDLGTSVEEQGPWTSLQAARAVLDVARGLNAAALAGLIHRDVKPSNLVLLHDGSVKVTDFGLAKPMDPGDQPALTALGVVVGTPDYIAPEQARGDKIDHRVDIYALGGTLYYLLTGIPPFRTGNPHQDKYLKVVARHLKNPPPDASLRNPIVDRQLSRLLRRMMAKEPGERPDYVTLIEQLEVMVDRIARDSGPATPVGKDRGKRAASDRVSPTPIVTDGVPAAHDTVVMADASDAPYEDDDDAMATQVRMPSQSAAPLAASAPARSQPDGFDRGNQPIESTAATPRVATAAMPGWVWVITIISLAIFAAGLALRFFGPVPESRTRAPNTDRDNEDLAPIQTPNSDVGSRGAPAEVPAGMIPIERDGMTRFYVDPRPVTVQDYAKVFPAHQHASAADGPVRDVSIEYAAAYADTVGKRLPTAEQWRAAAQDPAFVGEAGLWEWLAKPADEPADGRYPVISRDGDGTRPAEGATDVTFRLVMIRP